MPPTPTPRPRVRRAGRAASVATLALLVLGACSRPAVDAAGARTPDPRPRQAAAPELADPRAFEDARRGLIAAPTGEVRNEAGDLLWDFGAFAFVQGDAPPTVHPGLWRQAQLNNEAGLFKVRDGIWQLRGFDLANMTLIEGRTGWIVVDTLTSRETAAAALAFARRHLGDKPVSAIVFSHSHVDHFGGALGVLSAEEAKARRVPIVAPSGFLAEATSENLLLGPAMGRRAAYMYGNRLPRSPLGLVDNGLGKSVAMGRIGVLAPTLTIDRPRQEVTLDGVRFVFHDMPGSEAPAELTFALPELQAFGGTELMSHTLHNVHTPRGAKVRDALRWANYIDDTLRHAEGAEVLFNQHHWPVWGRERIVEFITMQRDVYRFIHDQTVRQMNAGLSAAEIAETLTLPRSLREHLSVRGHYGTVRHNVKGVVQHYLGWFDAHPAHLDALPPVDAARRYVELFGGIEQTVAAAQRAFDAGEFRWAAELLKHAVYAEPRHAGARELLARCFEQMGYASEASTWRNFYLTGALELRQGPPERGIERDRGLDMLQHTPVERLLEAMAASLDGAKAEGSDLRIDLFFTDLGTSYRLWIENAVLHFRAAPPAPDAHATLRLTHPFFLRMMTGRAGALALLTSSETQIDGSRLDLGRFFSMFDQAPGTFPIVTR
jgi:alkyl sulfatase BDS1-like metallo-beta-lactamase superfamily hydrolase